MRGRALPVAALLAALVACQQEFPIAVTGKGKQVEFTVPATSPPCVAQITVYAAADRANPIWLIDAVDRSQCPIRFRYGVVPAGFEQRGPAAPLVHGRRYVVAVKRANGTAVRFFEPGGDGAIERDPPR